MSFIKKVLNKVLAAFGYELIKFPKILGVSGHKQHSPGYERLRPVATYAPWSIDNEFTHLYETVIKNTKVDKFRCYELWHLISQCNNLDGAILEVGVWRGGTSAIICKSAMLNNVKQNIYLADTFEGVVKAGEHDTYYMNGAHDDTSEETVKNLLKDQLGLNNFKILKGIFPDDTEDKIADQNFCFCHIDVDVYESAKDIVDWIWPKLCIGGMIVFDDYGFAGCVGLTKYVNSLVSENNNIHLHNMNGHAIIIKVK